MAKSELKLLGAWFSPFTVRARIALNIKGLDYAEVEESFNPKSDLLLKSNPVHKKIPVLLHGDKSICESTIIVEYIDEVWSNGSSILPDNVYDCANARFWVSYIDDKYYTCLRNITGAGEDMEAKKPHLDQMVEELARIEEAFQKCSKGKALFGGDKIGIIDIAFGSFLSWLRVIENRNGRKLIVEDKTPGLVKWTHSFDADPAVSGTQPDIDKLAEYGKAVVAKMAAATNAK